jgi:hypothetical protein
MRKFSHLCSIAFTIVSNDMDGADITADMFRAALEKRIADLDRSGDLEWQEAVAILDTSDEDGALA